MRSPTPPGNKLKQKSNPNPNPNPNQDGVKLVLMRAVAMPGRKLQTYTRQADGSEGRVVTRDARKWAKLKPTDLGDKADGLI